MKRFGHAAVVAILLVGVVGGAYGWAQSRAEPKPAKLNAVATSAAAKTPMLTAALEVPATVRAGEFFTIKYRMGNIGNARAEDVRFVLDVPASNFGTVVQQEEMVNRIEGDALDPGQKFSLSYSTLARVPGEQQITFTVTAAGGRKATATAKVKVLAPKMEVKIEGPAKVEVGQHEWFTITLTNTGNKTAEDVRLEVQLGRGISFTPLISFGPSVEGEYKPPSPAPVVFTALNPGQTENVRLWCRTDSPGESILKVTATEKSGSKVTAECRTTVVKLFHGIHFEVVDSVNPVKVGDEMVYEVKVKNTGTATEKNLKLVCELRGPLSLVEVDAPENFTLSSQVLNRDQQGNVRDVIRIVTFEPVAALWPNAEVVFKVKARGRSMGNGGLAATLRSDHLTTPVTKEEPTTVYEK